MCCVRQVCNSTLHAYRIYSYSILVLTLAYRLLRICVIQLISQESVFSVATRIFTSSHDDCYTTYLNDDDVHPSSFARKSNHLICSFIIRYSLRSNVCTYLDIRCFLSLDCRHSPGDTRGLAKLDMLVFLNVCIL